MPCCHFKKYFPTYATAYSITVDENTFSLAHYSFAGWNTEADGTGIAYTAEEVIALTAQNNTETLYAALTTLSGLGLAALGLKKKEEDTEA